ncbi:MAG: D-alanyl-D-alanine carboxypeptidase, partial [Clostridia bacterium]|nr:D-alanyl-D-alanine carboxypeptidase [Clostridia bacterium]
FETIENGNLKYDDVLTVSEYAASMGGSQVFLEPGETMEVEELLKCVIIASANDAALTLAEHIAGSEEAFVDMMNKRAYELKMKNTHFENVTGLDDDVTNHLTTAYDIALMSRELIKHQKVSEYATIWMDTIRDGEFGLTNTNRLVRFYKGITGLKTGSTSKAGFCVSATAKRDGLELIAVIMGAESSDIRNACATKLLDYGFANYSIYQNEGANLGTIKVLGGTKDNVAIKFDSYNSLENKGNKNKITYETNINENIEAPVKKGDVVGEIKYMLNGEIIGKSEIYCIENINKISFWEFFIRILENFILK